MCLAQRRWLEGQLSLEICDIISHYVNCTQYPADILVVS